jgi:hypothetical protein
MNTRGPRRFAGHGHDFLSVLGRAVAPREVDKVLLAVAGETT